MVTLRLFHAANPFRPIETRSLEAGEICIGRDPAADWPIEDAACELSRRHCAIRYVDGQLRVRDMSANGVFVGQRRRRLARDQESEVQVGEPIYIGQYLIAAESGAAPANDHAREASLDALFHSPILREPELSPDAFQVRSSWPAATPSKLETDRVRLPDAALLEAFCEGAGLDPSMFMAEDAADVMRRAGAVYQQAVLGLSDLMGERTSLKSTYRMDRTTVGAADNNPFKWADAHRVAVDLLRANSGPFLGGASAINHSFQDLKKHLLCLMAGSRAAVSAALEDLAPSRIEQEASSGLFQGKAEACWRNYQRRHEEIASDARESADGAISLAFKAGYERHVGKLSGLGTLA
ncbi:MAG: type VI secretion system-associated FHA domain protein TagH [Hyphomonadaceae bacterium]